MKDVKQSFNNFLEESRKYPEGLSDVEYRLEKRIASGHKKRNAVFSSLSAAAIFCLFVILVNTNTTFASSVSELPLVGTLAEFVKFDKSLSNAIENDYVQEVNLTAWDGQEQLSLPYVIADEKNLVLFFQLPQDFELKPNQWAQIDLEEMTDTATGEKIEDGFSYCSSSLSAEDKDQNHGFLQQTYQFVEGDLPQSIQIKMNLEIEEESVGSQEVSLEDSAFEDDPKPIMKKVGTFTFQIDFNEFAKPIVYEFHKKYTVKNQQITLEEMKVYPTGTEISFTFPDENSAWIKGLDLAIEQNGKIILEGRDGISATGGDKNKSIFIESNYFDKPKEQKLLIQGIRLLDKDEEYITVDLNSKTISPAISGMKLKEVTKKNGKAALVFETKLPSDDGSFGLLSFEYQDTAGNTYELNHEGTSGSGFLMETRVTVEDPADGKLIFRRDLTPMQPLEDPIRISLPAAKN